MKEDEKETGQTSTAIAVATQMAIQHNKKVLLISTYENNKEIDAAYIKPQAQKSNLLSFLNLNKKTVSQCEKRFLIFSRQVDYLRKPSSLTIERYLVISLSFR